MSGLGTGMQLDSSLILNVLRILVLFSQGIIIPSSPLMLLLDMRVLISVSNI